MTPHNARDPLDAGRPVPDVRAAARACKARDYNLEAIPVFLVLEDLSGEQEPEGGDLGRLGAHYLRELDDEPLALATALEVLAAHHFGLGA